MNFFFASCQSKEKLWQRWGLLDFDDMILWKQQSDLSILMTNTLLFWFHKKQELQKMKENVQEFLNNAVKQTASTNYLATCSSLASLGR